MAFQIDADRGVQGFADNLALVAHFDEGRIQIQDRPDARQRSRTPLLNAFIDRFANRRDELRRDRHLQEALNVARAQ